MKSIYKIIKSPLITEKATALGVFNKYVFWIEKAANRIEVKNAVEKIYKVKVGKVNVMNVKGKLKRIKMGQEGRTPAWKKAVVTLKKGQSIKIT
ncbi:MAG: 50S ribosomal protein L23 [Candidatus Omnitrophica bacterium]|nr:50S ribosomal protein L23 [Candidatus Omnitrophota bacterium]